MATSSTLAIAATKKRLPASGMARILRVSSRHTATSIQATGASCDSGANPCAPGQGQSVTRTVPELELSRLGRTRRLAIRTLLTEFRAKGWRDVDGAAMAMIERIERNGGRASPRAVANATPKDFLAVNAV